MKKSVVAALLSLSLVAPAISSDWGFTEQVSVIDDSKTISLYTEASAPAFERGMERNTKQIFVFSCNDLDQGVSVAVLWGVPMDYGIPDKEIAVTQRIGSDTAEDKTWQVYENAEQTYVKPNDIEPFIKEMLREERLVVRAKSLFGSTGTAIFDMTGFTESAAKLLSLCKINAN